MSVTTPELATEQRPPTRRRRVLTWVALGVVFVVISLVLFAVASATSRQEKLRFDPENHGPDGFNALTSVLRDRGVNVEVKRSWEEALAASDGATLAFVDPPALSDKALTSLFDAAAAVVLLDPTSRTLDLGLGGATDAGFTDNAIPAECDFGPAATAGEISGSRLFSGGDAACFRSGDGAAVITSDGITAVDGTLLFTNSTITQSGNAALALALLGQHDTLVWYVPNATDSDLAGATSLADLTPPWVTPVLVLGALSAVAAAIWRGRRFGPLVAERLPVTVRVAETLEGRARLYARARDSAHAGAVLRRTSAANIGARLGLGRRAPILAVADAAASTLAVPAEQVRAILAGPPPQGDDALMQLSDRLTRLEAAIGAAVRAEGKRP